MFDFVVLGVFLAVALLFKSKASSFCAVESIAQTVLIVLLLPVLMNRVFHLLFGIECLLFLLVFHCKIEGFAVVKLSLALTSALHSVVVISYYSLPYEGYLTVYNLYPKLYLMLIALQILGLINGSNRQRIDNGERERAADFVYSRFKICRAIYKRA